MSQRRAAAVLPVLALASALVTGRGGGDDDTPGAVKGGPYSEGVFPGAGQFGTVTVTETGGATVDVELAGRDWRGEVLVSLRTTFDVPSG
jgi:hypothetical protein